MYFEFRETLRDFAIDGPTVEYMVALPEKVLEFQAIDVVFDQSRDVSGQNYCGKTEYNLVMQDGSAIDPNVIIFDQNN